MTFQIWDVTVSERIHEADSVADHRLSTLRACLAAGCRADGIDRGGDYDAYLLSWPVRRSRTFTSGMGAACRRQRADLSGRQRQHQPGIAATLVEVKPAHFFAYNNGIAATASNGDLKADGPGWARYHDHRDHRYPDRERGPDHGVSCRAAAR